MTSTARAADWRTPTVVLICAGLVLTLSMGIRHGFGLFLQPMSSDLGWGRETFALALAVQNLMWGATQPFAGMLADKYGTARVVVMGALLYSLGLVTMAHSTTPVMLVLTAGVLIGTGLSGLTFSVVAGVLGRRFPPEQRSMALGISAAAGSFGQFAMLPATQFLLSTLGWFGALVTLGLIGLAIVPLAAALVERRASEAPAFNQSAREAVREAFGHRGYLLLCLGYTVCGFQLLFISVHFPAYLLDQKMSPQTGMMALALIGLFNVFGSYVWGWLGGRYTKKYLLSLLYFARAALVAVFVALPLTPFSVYLFAAVIGFLWLGTVPLTSGLIAHVFGVRYLATLSGIAFLFHQVGSSAGIWLAGYLFDATGSYRLMWLLIIAMGVVAGLVNLPIDDRQIARPVMKPA